MDGWTDGWMDRHTGKKIPNLTSVFLSSDNIYRRLLENFMIQKCRIILCNFTG